MTACEWCQTPLPPPSRGRRARRFCSDTCRKRTARAAAAAVPPVTTTDVTEGPVALAVRAALADVGYGAVGAARGEMAVVLARLVDAGSVPAARELRPLLADLDLLEDVETQRFLASIQAPLAEQRRARG